MKLVKVSGCYAEELFIITAMVQYHLTFTLQHINTHISGRLESHLNSLT